MRKLDKIDDLIKRYESAGWVAYRHPKKRTISLNGFRAIRADLAVVKMQEALGKRVA